MKKQLSVMLAAVVTAAAVLSFSASATAANSQAEKSITVAADTTFPPFETEKHGKVTGFDIDMIEAIAKAENLQLRIKTMPFNGIIPSLKTGAVNAAVAGITITNSRRKNVDYSNAYYRAGLSILVKKGSSIKDFPDLKGHIIATKKGTSTVTYLVKHHIDLSHVKQYQNISSAYQALLSGGVDAVVFDNPVNVNFTNQHKSVETVGNLLTKEYYGIAVSKKDASWLVPKFNDGLAKIKKSGLYRKLFEKYFGGDTSGLVKGVKKPAEVSVVD
jgi:polar amino acid transport system substrate-binding protein/glutamine transport system substrate-binding protein